MDDWCDYCQADMPRVGNMRAVGWTKLTEDGPDLPLVKFWCGSCEPDDEINLEAHAVVANWKEGK